MGLFGFGRKRESERSQASSAPQIDEAVIRQKIDGLKQEVMGLEGTAAAAVFDAMGADYELIGDVDGAIEAYESSLDAHRTMGKASAALVKLYNAKRAQAARDRDDDAIKYYLDKVNEMLSISKDSLRGRV
ncbi:MAG: hypothetical protein SOU51_01570 [Collinsella sp.]|nr:hypothetical protein [Collinsella sp.]